MYFLYLPLEAPVTISKIGVHVCCMGVTLLRRFIYGQPLQFFLRSGKNQQSYLGRQDLFQKPDSQHYVQSCLPGGANRTGMGNHHVGTCPNSSSFHLFSALLPLF